MIMSYIERFLGIISTDLIKVSESTIFNFRYIVISKWLVSVFAVSTLSACVSGSRIDVPSQDPAAVEDRAIVDGDILPLPNDAAIKSESLEGDVPMSSVVRTLVASADDQRRIGNWPGAAVSLERALRIEPRNGRLWSLLAHIHFDQREWNKAIQTVNELCY